MSPAAPTDAGRRTARLLCLGLAAVVVALDQWTKHLAVTGLEWSRPQPLLGDVLRLHLIANPGAAFGLGESMTPLLAVLAAAVTVVLLVTVATRLGSRLWGVALGLVLAGVVGNLVDRLVRAPGPLHGRVIDFLELPHWPIFNVADMALCAGAALAVLASFTASVGLDGRPLDPRPDETAETASGSAE